MTFNQLVSVQVNLILFFFFNQKWHFNIICGFTKLNTEQTTELALTLNTGSSHPHPHLNTQIPTLTTTTSLKKLGEFLFLQHMCTGNIEEMEEGCRTSPHVTVWLGMQQGEEREGCVLDKMEGGVGGQKHLSPLSWAQFCLLLFHVSWPATATERRKNRDQQGMGESDLIRCRASPLN